MDFSIGQISFDTPCKIWKSGEKLLSEPKKLLNKDLYLFEK